MESAVPTRPVPAAGPESPEPPGWDPGPAPAHLPRPSAAGNREADRSKSAKLQVNGGTENRRDQPTGLSFHRMLSSRSALPASEKVSASAHRTGIQRSVLR